MAAAEIPPYPGRQLLILGEFQQATTVSIEHWTNMA